VATKIKRAKVPQKVFYKSVHEILKYDDLRILQHAGFDVFSRGAFSEMSSAANTFRQHARAFNSEEDIVAAASGGITTDTSGRERLSKDFAERFDVFVINQDYRFVLDNIEHMRNRPVIYRSIGQSTIGGEAALKAVADEIVTCRYYENEVSSDFYQTSLSRTHAE
jgi:hypothetical protein